MIEIHLSPHSQLTIHHLVLDFNGTLAFDGELIDGVASRLRQLSEKLKLHVLTADTHGTVREKVSSFSPVIHVIDTGDEDRQKADYIISLDAGVMAIGNGKNDTIMLKNAVVGVAVLQTEGLSTSAMQSADVLCTDINDALDLLLKPKRLVATLRN